jgi:hypothetical protein
MLIPRSNNTWPDEPAWDPARDAWGDASWNWEAKGWNKGRPWAAPRGKRMAEFIKAKDFYGFLKDFWWRGRKGKKGI